MRHFRTDLAVETKPDHSPVTQADRACERRIVEILLSEFPDYGLCGEEQGEHPRKTARRWIIDPIDGTKSFVRGIPFFATLIVVPFAPWTALTSLTHAESSLALFMAKLPPVTPAGVITEYTAASGSES